MTLVGFDEGEGAGAADYPGPPTTPALTWSVA